MKTFIITFFTLLISLPVLADDVSPIGVWLTADGGAKVEIYANPTKLEGKIIWLKEPLDKDGAPKKDTKNKDAKLQSRPIMGMVFLTGFEKKGGEWTGGEIYDAKSGKTYTARLVPEGTDKLKVNGYVIFTWAGRTDMWTRQTL